MRFNGQIILATFISIVIYFVLSIIIYTNADLRIGFLDILSKQLLIIAGLFAGGFILSLIMGNDDTSSDEDKYNSLEENISNIAHDTIFSTPPFDIRLGKAVSKIKKSLGCEAVYVAIYSDNQINIIGQETNSADLFLERRLNLSSSDKKPKTDFFNSPRDLIINFFHENEDQNTNGLRLDNSYNLESFTVALKPEASLKSFGSLCLVMPDKYIFTKKTKNYINFLANAIAFASNIHLKKDAILQANIRYYKQHNEIDEVLNIFNKNKIEKTIDLESERHKRYLTPLSLIYLSIDDMEKISNIMSSQELVSMKQSFASLVKEKIRNIDIFGLCQDDIFAIIAPNTDYQGAHIMTTKLSSIIKKHSFHRISNLTCSFGITTYSFKDTPALFRSRAKNAMLKAREKGGDCSEIQLLV